MAILRHCMMMVLLKLLLSVLLRLRRYDVCESRGMIHRVHGVGEARIACPMDVASAHLVRGIERVMPIAVLMPHGLPVVG